MKQVSHIFYLLLILFFSSNILVAADTAQAQHMQALQQVMQQVQAKIKANPNLSKEERKAMIQQILDKSNMGQEIVRKQKEHMPKALKILKSNRACLAKAETKSQAVACGEKAKVMAKELGIKGNSDNKTQKKDFIWNEKKKKYTIARMDKSIKKLETTLPCIQKAQTLSDMQQCRH